MAYIRRKLAIYAACILVSLLLYDVIFEEHFDPVVLKGRNVLLTGASSGIGEQMAYYFAKHGANLVITARRENRLQQVTEKCRSLAAKGVTIDYVKADMSNMEEARAVVQKTITILGSIDHVMLNHAMTAKIDAWTGSKEKVAELNKYMQANFHSYVEVASTALPHLMERKGTITVTSSILGKVPLSNALGYSTSKFAMQGFFEGLQEEMIERQTNVSITIAPLGTVDTEVTHTIKPGPNMKISMVDIKVVKLMIFTPSGKPEDCAKEMIKATYLRKKEIVFPRSRFRTFFMFIHHVCPSVLDLIPPLSGIIRFLV